MLISPTITSDVTNLLGCDDDLRPEQQAEEGAGWVDEKPTQTVDGLLLTGGAAAVQGGLDRQEPWQQVLLDGDRLVAEVLAQLLYDHLNHTCEG